MRTTYRWCTICGGSLHEVQNWPDNCRPEYNYARSDLPAPAIVSDRMTGGINGMLSMADGKHYDSKSAYYKSLKERGCEIVDGEESFRLDNLMDKEFDRGPSEKDVRKAVLEARDMLTQSSLSDTEMANMVRAQVPAEDIIPAA